MKYLIVGTGFIFPSHVQAIRDVGGKIREVVNTTGDWREVIRNSDADVVVALTPNDLHVEIAKCAVAHGKKVLCEKPLGTSPEDIADILDCEDIFTVLQLRYHPLVKEIPILAENTIDMDISVYRDQKYYDGWKGQEERSGGPLLNLGVHYFDMLIHLFGKPKRVSVKNLDAKTGTGTIWGDGYTCTFRISTDAPRDQQRRLFAINGVNYNFSTKDNLSFENLHTKVYEDLEAGRGIHPKAALPAIMLVEYLKSAHLAGGQIKEALKTWEPNQTV